MTTTSDITDSDWLHRLVLTGYDALVRGRRQAAIRLSR